MTLNRSNLLAKVTTILAATALLTGPAITSTTASPPPQTPNSQFGGIMGGDVLITQCSYTIFLSLIQEYNYPFEVHSVTTEDGHILQVFRIQAQGTKIVSGKPVVFLQHGLTDSADDWVINTPSRSLGLVLADRGYDVWLGNSRGNKYSLATTRKMSTKEFWAYSFQQMGLYDVPANIKYVLGRTGQKTLDWIGHSQGTAQVFVALTDPTTRDYVNSKIRKFIALAPIVYLSNSKILPLKILATQRKKIEAFAKALGVYIILPAKCQDNDHLRKLTRFICSKVATGLCNAVFTFMDPVPRVDDLTRWDIYLKHVPSGTSLMTLSHFAQMINQSKGDPVFRRFDYGKKENLKKYGQATPPRFELEKIRTKVRMYVATADPLGDTVDNQILYSRLKGYGIDVKRYFLKDWGHMTFMWAKDPSPEFAEIFRELETD